MIDFHQVDNWLAARDFAGPTSDKYRGYLARLDAWLDRKELYVEDLEPRAFAEFLASQPWGRKTRHNCLYAVRSWLRSQGILDHPIMFMQIRLPEPGPQRTVSAEQARQLLATCDAGSRPKDIRNGAMVSLLMDTGLRASELCRLVLPADMLVKRRLSVLGKGQRWRHCIFSAATAERILVWNTERERFAKNDVYELFVSVGGLTPGRALTVRGLRLIFRDLARRAGIPALSTHDFRRGFAVASAQNRMPLRLLQLQGGWSRAQTAARYLNSMTLEDAEAFLPMEQQVET